jgi:hypothetical protein
MRAFLLFNIYYCTKNAHIYIYREREREKRERIQNYVTIAPTCFGASASSSGTLIMRLLKLQNIKITLFV